MISWWRWWGPSQSYSAKLWRRNSYARAHKTINNYMKKKRGKRWVIVNKCAKTDKGGTQDVELDDGGSERYCGHSNFSPYSWSHKRHLLPGMANVVSILSCVFYFLRKEVSHQKKNWNGRKREFEFPAFHCSTLIGRGDATHALYIHFSSCKYWN